MTAIDDFFTHYYARRPVNATFTGVHAYDDRLPDWSPDGLAAMDDEMRSLGAELAREYPAPASVTAFRTNPDLLDAELARGLLEIQRAENASLHGPRGNPALWTGEAVFSIIALPGVSEQVVTGSPRQLFAQVRPGGGLSQQLGLRAADAAGTIPIALGRMGIAHGWAGLGAVWTKPAYRGRGLAAHLSARLAAAARAEGIHLVHLQVEHDNETAIRLYRRLGFDVHSSYAYLTQG